MKVFLSWSGEYSRRLAVQLRDWFPCLLQDVEAWVSTNDIAPGQTWASSLFTGLRDTNFGIICATPDSLESQWVLFEAGAIARAIEASRVVPLRHRIEVADLPAPLQSFQSVDTTRNGILRLCREINSRRPRPLGDVQLSIAFDKWWPDLELFLSQLVETDQTLTRGSKTERQILEEVLKNSKRAYVATQALRLVALEERVTKVFETVAFIRRLNVDELKRYEIDAEKDVETDRSANAFQFLETLRKMRHLGLVTVSRPLDSEA